MSQAKFTHRVFAFGVDLTFIGFLQIILGGATIGLYNIVCHQMGIVAETDTELFISQFCGAFFFIGYFTFVQGFWGHTLGKKLFKLKVVDGHTLKPLGIKASYWRSLAYLMSSWTYCIGFILPLFRKDKLALHDLLCGTKVVHLNTKSSTLPVVIHLPERINIKKSA